MLPKAEAKGFFGKLFELSNPKNWVSKTVTVYFVCAVTLKPGEPYELVLPTDWVTKYGPALRLGLSVLKVACGVGRLMGLPIPTINDAAEGVDGAKAMAADAVSEQTDFLNSVHDSITETMNEQPELEGVTEWMDEKLADTAAEWTEVPETQDAEGLPAAHEIVQKSFQEIRDLGARFEDTEFTRSGLVFAVCTADGTSEMVAPEVKELYEQHGAACVGLSEVELSELMQPRAETSTAEAKDSPTQLATSRQTGSRVSNTVLLVSHH
jgi:hypothetical protein